MMQFVSSQDSPQELHFPIQMKVMTKDETKEHHLKKLLELSLKSLGKIPQLEEPTKEQKEWVNRRMKDPEWIWRARNK